MNEDRPQMYPPWREAITKFQSEGFAYGDILSFEWLYEAFGLEMPLPDTTLAKAEKIELQFLSQFKSFQTEMLQEYSLDLVNERGKGYLVVHPRDQTQLAYEDGLNEIRKGLRRMVRRLVHIDHSKLTAEQRRENADKLARSAMLRGMIKEAKRMLPPPGEDG